MVKLNRLKWIPMILQAYHEAQLKMAPNDPRNIPDGVTPLVQHTTTRRSAAPIRPKVQTSASKTQNVKTRSAAEVQNNLSKGKPLAVKKAKPQKSAVLQGPVNLNEYKLMMKELRSASKKLGALDSIHQQLKNVEDKLDAFQQWIAAKPDSESTTHQLQSSKIPSAHGQPLYPPVQYAAHPHAGPRMGPQ